MNHPSCLCVFVVDYRPHAAAAHKKDYGVSPMSVLVDENTRLLVQGITGGEGSQHARRSIAYGTNVVAGVTPGRGGQMFDDKVPVFNTVKEAVRETAANVS